MPNEVDLVKRQLNRNRGQQHPQQNKCSHDSFSFSRSNFSRTAWRTNSDGLRCWSMRSFISGVKATVFNLVNVFFISFLRILIVIKRYCIVNKSSLCLLYVRIKSVFRHFYAGSCDIHGRNKRKSAPQNVKGTCKPPETHYKDQTSQRQLPEDTRCVLRTLTHPLSDHVVAWNAASSPQFKSLLDISIFSCRNLMGIPLKEGVCQRAVIKCNANVLRLQDKSNILHKRFFYG